MGLFGKSEYERQLEVSAKHQAETEAQLQTSRKQQEIFDKQSSLSDNLLQREHDLQDRMERLITRWETQTLRLEAILEKLEKLK